ncbi:hypothetical protein [Streptomyces sp. f150]|uniref:hypothetical protein n=1 Tax=Streptomyces sp. f150 TaxID=1827699 RepID=UPI000BF1D0AF|nr:hypothetical protein [Streptomyces sp. f150]
MGDRKAPSEIGAYALNKAVEYADKAERLAGSSFTSAKDNADHIAIYGGLATVYADIAKAAALTAT